MEKWFTQKNPTHLQMNGGPSLCVPWKDRERFMTEYINQVKTKKLYLVELKSPVFKFFMDIDYLADEKLTREQIIEISKRVNEKIPGKCLVAVSKPYEKDNKIKCGIHLHWPDLNVTKLKALEIRKCIDDDIKQYVDESVYKGSGLRMLWSFKKCDYSPYVPLYDLSSSTWLDQNPSIDMLKLFSIRTNEKSSDEESLPKTDGGPIEKFINRYIRGHEQTTVKKVKKRGIQWKVETNSKFCENRNGTHKSNHVYFVIDTKKLTIHQECFDEDCKGFKGKKYKLSSNTIDVNKTPIRSDDFGDFLPDD